MPVRGRGGRSGKRASSSIRLYGTKPCTPTIGTATDIGTNRPYDNAAVSVSFTPDSNCTPATSYTVISNAGHTSSASSSPILVTGLSSGVSYTFQVRANNQYGSSDYSSSTNSVLATTVPQTPSAPSASSPSAGSDTISWTAPANGGKGITNYHWESNDGKSGDTGSTSAGVAQEQGTTQAYRVYATNANGNSDYSGYSSNVTTTFSFAPFSVFGFSPFGVFGFSPFGVFGFSPFGFSPFGFSPFGFSPFGFSPFGFSPFGFSPFGFAPNTSKSLFGDTKVRTPNGLVSAAALSVGDQVLSVVLPGLPESGWTPEDVIAWNLPNPSDLDLSNTVVTTVQEIVLGTADLLVFINGDGFSGSHGILVKRNENAMFVRARDILESDLIWSLTSNSWQAITTLEKHEAEHQVWSINTEPYDIFFTENMLVHDTRPEMPPTVV